MDMGKNKKSEEALKELKEMHEFVDYLNLTEEKGNFLKKHPFMLPSNWKKLIDEDRTYLIEKLEKMSKGFLINIDRNTKHALLRAAYLLKKEKSHQNTSHKK